LRRVNVGRLIISLFLLMSFLGCATTMPTITQSTGNPDLTKYKTFAVKPAYSPNTIEYFREFRVLQNLIVRFEQEGYKFLEASENPDLNVSVDFKDKILQMYVPPSTHVTVTENPDTTTSNTIGTISSMGNMAMINANTQSQSTGSTTVTTRTTGGGYVPYYAIDLTLNVYDRKTDQLLWSGEGASRANPRNVFPQIDRILLDVIDSHLMSPAYMSGDRDKYRNKGLEGLILGPADYSDDSENEYLKPLTTQDKIGFYQVNYKFDVNGIGVLGTMSVERQLMNLLLSFKNNNKESIEFDPDSIKVVLKGRELRQYSKSDITSLFFKGSQNDKSARDKIVKLTQTTYLEKHKIEPLENYLVMDYLATPFRFTNGDKKSITFLIIHEPVSIE